MNKKFFMKNSRTQGLWHQSSPVIYFKYRTCNISLDATECNGVCYVGNKIYRLSLKDKKDLNSQKTSTVFFSFEIMQ